MPVASRTFVNFEILQNADFEQSINFSTDYDFDSKDYELSIAADYSSNAIVTLKSDDPQGSTNGAARLVLIESSGNASVLSVRIPAVAGAGSGANTFKTGDFADDFEGVWELLERSSSGDVIRQAEGDVIVRNGLFPTLFTYDID